MLGAPLTQLFSFYVSLNILNCLSTINMYVVYSLSDYYHMPLVKTRIVSDSTVDSDMSCLSVSVHLCARPPPVKTS